MIPARLLPMLIRASLGLAGVGEFVEPPLPPRVTYRPQTAPPPSAYRPMSATLPTAYRPSNPSTPGG